MTGHVLVAGAGIAGTAVALALRRAGIGVTVAESRAADHAGGAGVRLNPNAMDALRAIGADGAVIAASASLVRTEVFSPTGERLSYRLAADPASPRGLPRSMLWNRLSTALRDEAARAGAEFRHDTRVTGVTRTADGIVALLDDGGEIVADALVGADGVRSAVRTWIDPDAPAPQGGRTRTIYGFTPDPPCEPPPPEVLRIHLGARAFFASRRDAHSGGCSWFTNVPVTGARAGDGDDLRERDLRERLDELFGDDDSPAASTVRHADRVLGFDDLALPHVPRWHTDRMIVIGDALHVAPPASEQGAAMAIEDGVVLAQCLRDRPRPADAFAAFEALRRERVEAVVALGLGNAPGPPRRGAARLLHRARDRFAALGRLATLSDWQRRPPTGGPAWAYDHHIDWTEKMR
ncbi:MAG: FAD-dependent monooxygenase [Pseudonocardia sp.]|nr:FAD-dependent monooxygenase [Pseudonocardia sp.]